MKTVTDHDVKFLLKDARATGPTLVYLVYRFDNQRFKYSTEQRVEPYQWDTVTQRAHVGKAIKLSKTERDRNQTLNAHLDRHRAALVQLVAHLQLAGQPLTADVLRAELDNRLDRQRPAPKPVEPVAVAEPETFIAFIGRFVADARDGKRLNAKQGRFSDGTLTNYLKFRNILLAYQTDTRQTLTNDSFTLAFYHRLNTWLVGKGHTLNYVGAVLNGVKMLLKQAHRDGLVVSPDFQHKEFRKVEEEVDNIYLSDADLQTVYALDLTAHPRLDRVRDVFLIGCYTGLRFTNYTQLRPENITHGGRLLTVQAIKNGPKVSIPLNPNVLAILAKYDRTDEPAQLPRALTNQKFNQYLKELGQRAGFTQSVERTRTVGGKRATQTAQTWELMTTHTARRSFATNAFLAGVPTVSIMKITGHKSEGQFLKYIKITSEQNALLMLEHPHFGGAGSQSQPAIVRPLHKAA